MKKLNVAIVGATGLVGRKFIEILEERKFPVGNLYLFATSKSAGTKLKFNDKEYEVEELTEKSFEIHKTDIALFSAGHHVSKKYAPIAACTDCVVIDNSSAWRMDNTVPLVIPEVNPKDALEHKGIIANPNCSTIQLVMVLNLLNSIFKIKRVVVSTYQAVSGAGSRGMRDLQNGTTNKFPYVIQNNCIPHIDVFNDLGYTKEELKLINETRKIMHDNEIMITATAVRVPVLNCHSESVNIEFESQFDIGKVIEVLDKSPGIALKNNFNESLYPMPITADGNDEVFVGRIRRDYSVDNGLNLWIVADNMRKGAATNAIQIAELIIKKGRKK